MRAAPVRLKTKRMKAKYECGELIRHKHTKREHECFFNVRQNANLVSKNILAAKKKIHQPNSEIKLKRNSMWKNWPRRNHPHIDPNYIQNTHMYIYLFAKTHLLKIYQYYCRQRNAKNIIASRSLRAIFAHRSRLYYLLWNFIAGICFIAFEASTTFIIKTLQT